MIYRFLERMNLNGKALKSPLLLSPCLRLDASAMWQCICHNPRLSATSKISTVLPVGTSTVSFHLDQVLENAIHGYVLDAASDGLNWDHYKVLSS